MDDKATNILKTISPKKVIFPILLGIAIVFILFFKGGEIDWERITDSIKKASIAWILAAVGVLLVRDVGYMYRIRHLTSKMLSWKSSFFVIILWEFASAVTPSAVGGTAVAAFIINREGIPFGKSLAYVMLTATFDNLFFVIASILVITIVPFEIFPSEFSDASKLIPLFIISVTLIAVYTFFMTFGLLAKPKFFKLMLVRLATLRILGRWKRKLVRLAIESGNDVITASGALKGENWWYWTKAGVSTVFIWVARYLMLNCLIAAFVELDMIDHIKIFSRQIVMWVVMLISPTPGSTGTAEYTFEQFFNEFFHYGGLTLMVAVFWRLFTYYAYLLLGVFVLTRWMRRVIYGVPDAQISKA
ncbi:MAG: lysylphosphatidylglycerol synthase transmembrane domain-containing protein [Flammeovirgaceae bacterium]